MAEHQDHLRFLFQSYMVYLSPVTTQAALNIASVRSRFRILNLQDDHLIAWLTAAGAEGGSGWRRRRSIGGAA